MKKAVIVSAVRTPVGSYGGAFKDVSAVNLGTIAVKEAIKRANIKPEMVDEVIFGNVLQAGLGQNVARQVAIHAGIPDYVTSYTINKVCGSGLKTVALAAQAIKAGDAEIVVVGGTENMSQAPYLLPNNRWGQRMGNGQVIDYMVADGLTDIFNNYHMGITAENIVEKYSLTREEQDELACNSQNRAEKARAEGRFKEEIVAVEIPQRKGDPIVVSEDEYIKSGTTMETLGKLRPAFKKDGSVTAGNASGINDGAAALVTDFDAVGVAGDARGVEGGEFVERLAGGAEAHENADDFVAGAEEECRGDGGVDTAGHRDEDFGLRGGHGSGWWKGLRLEGRPRRIDPATRAAFGRRMVHRHFVQRD